MKDPGTLQILRNERDAQPYSADQVIFEKGDPGDVMYVVFEGEVDVVVGDEAIETVGPGGIFGEMALIDGSPRSARAVAKIDCRLVRIDEKRFTFLVQQTPFFALQVMRIITDRLRRTTGAVRGERASPRSA